MSGTVARLLTVPLLLLASCALAGAYGMIHNQISYTVSPEYFHDFKFIQFDIPSGTRRDASVVGWRASWWMGLILGLPVMAACLFIRDGRRFARTFLLVAASVVCGTLAFGLVALLLSFLTLDAGDLPIWAYREGVEDPIAFVHAGNMHNASYLGGIVSAGLGTLAAVITAIRLRKPSP